MSEMSALHRITDDPGSLAPPSMSSAILRRRDGAVVAAQVELAAEVPIAFEYNGVSHAVMLATPSDLSDFALGFSLSEGVIASPADCYGIEAHKEPDGITLAIEIAAAAFMGLKVRRRTLVGRTGCGICGTESLAQVLRPLPDLKNVALKIEAGVLARAHAALPAHQPLQAATGATHGAVWCRPDGDIVLAREDVGRHNALDKLIGALSVAKIDAQQGFIFVTSRASIEMVQKTASAGVAMLVAISAPTALGVEVARKSGMTLIGFARGAEFSIYSHPQRISNPER